MNIWRNVQYQATAGTMEGGSENRHHKVPFPTHTALA